MNKQKTFDIIVKKSDTKVAINNAKPQAISHTKLI